MKKLWDFGIGLLKRYRELVLYLVFGGLTTALNYVAYLLFTRVLSWGTMPATAVAWAVSVLFAYVTNKLWVFESRDLRPAYVLRELGSFIACRLFSGLVDLGVMYLTVDLWHWNDLVMKLVSNVVVIVLNYIFSKLLIFRKRPEGR